MSTNSPQDADYQTIHATLVRLGYLVCDRTVSQPEQVSFNVVPPGARTIRPVFAKSNKRGSYTLRPKMDGVDALMVIECEAGMYMADVQPLIEDIRHTNTWRGLSKRGKPLWNDNYTNKKFKRIA